MPGQQDFNFNLIHGLPAADLPVNFAEALVADNGVGCLFKTCPSPVFGPLSAHKRGVKLYLPFCLQ